MSTYSAEYIARALGGRKRGEQWMAQCPAHDDRTPSLAIRERDGRTLVHCFSGCEQERVIEALKARHLWDVPEEHIPPPASRKGEPSAVYWYLTDREGKRLQKRRYDYIKNGNPGKSCSWHQEDGTKGMGNLKPLLYNLEGLEAAPADTTVYFCEGEKVQQALERWSLLAVCSPYGSAKWTEDLAKPLHGRTVIILPDHDEPGRKHALEVAKSLKGKATVKIVDLPNLADKEDLIEWQGRGGTREALLALANETPEWDEGTGPSLITIRLRDVVREDVSWLWWPYIPLKKLTMVDGDPGIGKSWLVYAIAASVTRGWPLPGDKREHQDPGRVLLLAGEDGLGETVLPRLEDMGAELDLIECALSLKRGDEELALFLDEEGLAALEHKIRVFRPHLVIIDPIVAYLGGKLDTARSNEVRAILRPLGDIGNKYGCAVVATRHLTKAGGGNPLYRGQMSIDFNATARSVLLVNTDPEQPDQIVMAHIKSSLAEKGPAQGYHIGFDKMGRRTVLWDGEVEITAEDLLNGDGNGDSRSCLENAKRFLQEMLFEGPVASREVNEAAKSLNISIRTLERAKAELGVSWKRRGIPGRAGGGEVIVELPLQAEKPRGTILPFDRKSSSANAENTDMADKPLAEQPNERNWRKQAKTSQDMHAAKGENEVTPPHAESGGVTDKPRHYPLTGGVNDKTDGPEETEV